MCRLVVVVYLDFDSLVWLAVDKQIQERNNTSLIKANAL